LVVPLTWAIVSNTGDPAQSPILYSSVACVLAGAVWGDHCSPISDTTILSSMASDCDHIEHVRTQLPYAMLVAMVAIVVGTLPTAYGLPWWLALLVSAALLFGILRFAGQPVERDRPAGDAAGAENG
jgi:Na+/H+ antiporter NhaC